MKRQKTCESSSCLQIQSNKLLLDVISFFHLNPVQPPENLLHAVCKCLARIPYENLTKIISCYSCPGAEKTLRYPDLLFSDFLQHGTGGTCFSLTASAIALFRALDLQAQPILADRFYGPDTHCALLVSLADHTYLVDPGFMLHDPLNITTEQTQTVNRGFSDIVLEPQSGTKFLSLSTCRNNQKKYRLTYKMSPVDESEFRRAWERSFGWDMMNYPVLSFHNNDHHIYLQGNILKVQSSARTEFHDLRSDQLINCIRTNFRITPITVKKALHKIKWAI